MAFDPEPRLSGSPAPASSAADPATCLRAILPEWGLPADASVRPIAESENATFLAEAPDGRRAVFRLHRAGYNDAAAIASEHAWIDALRRDRTVDTPAILLRRDGTTVGSLGIDGGLRHVAAFEFMSGEEPSADGNLSGWFAELGRLTARLHRQSRAWTRPAGFARRIWTFETTLGDKPHWGDWRLALGLGPDGRDLLARAVRLIEARLATYGDGPERFGLIHADLRLANLLVERERLGVIDFDDCGFGWFMYDFAASISFIEHEPFIDALREAWVEGYRREAPLGGEDEAMLPVFVMLRRILLAAWIASRPDAEAAKLFGAGFTEGTLGLAERFVAGKA